MNYGKVFTFSTIAFCCNPQQFTFAPSFSIIHNFYDVTAFFHWVVKYKPVLIFH